MLEELLDHVQHLEVLGFECTLDGKYFMAVSCDLLVADVHVLHHFVDDQHRVYLAEFWVQLDKYYTLLYWEKYLDIGFNRKQKPILFLLRFLQLCLERQLHVLLFELFLYGISDQVIILFLNIL